MPNTIEARPSRLFWVVSWVLLVWGLAGLGVYIGYFLRAPAEYAAAVETAAKQQVYADYVANIPLWAIGAGVLAALARLLGAVGLLLRRAWALPLYIVALVAFLVALFRAFVLANAADAMSGPHIMIQVVFVALSVFAVWFAHWARSRGVLR